MVTVIKYPIKRITGYDSPNRKPLHHPERKEANHYAPTTHNSKLITIQRGNPQNTWTPTTSHSRPKSRPHEATDIIVSRINRPAATSTPGRLQRDGGPTRDHHNSDKHCGRAHT